MGNHLGFLLNSRNLKGGIYIPKFYNPEIENRLNELEDTHELISLSELISDGHASVSTGDEIGKMAYGTGSIPFVRTSDISNWELKGDPKQGVSEGIYEQYRAKQDIQAGDILVVKDGTYLIGQSCIVGEDDLPALYQSHLFKIRISKDSPYNANIVFAAINSPILKLQIRSVQFTADIIDTIGSRFLDLKLPIPKDTILKDRISKEVENHVSERGRLRKNLKTLPYLGKELAHSASGEAIDYGAFVPSVTTTFKTHISSIRGGIYIPKFYDPLLEKDILGLSDDYKLVTLQKLVDDGIIEWSVGIEVGKMAYGTGSIPFVRTSDISNWELKGDPKQGVSEGIYQGNKQDVEADDVFVVRDGTYLVGSSCIVTEQDTKILYCGGLYKFRVLKKDILDPYLLITLLNTPIVRRQMRSKQFTRDIIDTLGKRIFDIKIPIPKDKKMNEKIIALARETISERVALRDRAKHIVLELEGSLTEEERELLISS